MKRPFQPANKQRKTYWLDGHRVSYTVGPKAMDSLDELRDELHRIKPDSWVTDRSTRQRRLVPVVVESGTGAVHADVASAVDTILAAGFQDIHLGGGLGRLDGPDRLPRGR